jgi:hypothetical protein
MDYIKYIYQYFGLLLILLSFATNNIINSSFGVLLINIRDKIDFKINKKEKKSSKNLFIFMRRYAYQIILNCMFLIPLHPLLTGQGSSSKSHSLF